MTARVSSSPQQVTEVFKVAERDLNVARNNLKEGTYVIGLTAYANTSVVAYIFSFCA